MIYSTPIHLSFFKLMVEEFTVLPLAFESLGVRSMATYVETPDVRIVFDPGCALGPRFSLQPSEQEYLALSKAREKILRAVRKAQVLAISHYHFDHYTPHFEDREWTWSSPNLAERLYKGKKVLVKDYHDLPPVQRKRGYLFQKFNKEISELITADGEKFRWGKTEIEVSEPQPHGLSSSTSLLFFAVRRGDFCFVFAPDFQGVSEEALKTILRWKPSILVAGGPPLYLLGYRFTKEQLNQATSNLTTLVRRVPVVILDHHLFRSCDGPTYLRQLAERTQSKVVSAAEFLGKEPLLLEARRKELTTHK
jgi:predicted metallo-beta-lactamase superfamily hydrolase